MTWTMMKHGFQMMISYLQCSCFIIFLQSVWWCVMLQQPLIWLDTRRCFICSPQGSMNSWNQSARRYQIWCSAPRQDTMFRFAGGKESDGNLLYFMFFSLRSRVCVLEQDFNSSQNRGCLSKFLSLLTRGWFLLNWRPAHCKKKRPTESRTKQSESAHSWKQSELSTQRPTVVERYDDFLADAFFVVAAKAQIIVVNGSVLGYGVLNLKFRFMAEQ